MVWGRFRELVEGGKMCGEVCGHWMKMGRLGSGCWTFLDVSAEPVTILTHGNIIEEKWNIYDFSFKNKLDCTRRKQQTSIMDRLVFQTLHEF